MNIRKDNLTDIVHPPERSGINGDSDSQNLTDDQVIGDDGEVINLDLKPSPRYTQSLSNHNPYKDK